MGNLAILCGFGYIETPWGNFPLFYESLIPGGYLIESKIYEGNQNSSFLKSYTCQPSPDIQPISEITKKKFNGLELIKTLPDMYFILEKLGIETNLCRGNIEIIQTRHYKTDSTGQQYIDTIQEIHNFGINAKSELRKSKLLNRYMTNSKNPLMLIVSETDTLAHTQLITQFDPKSEIQKIEYYPEIVDDINGINFFIVNPGSYLPEIIAQFILLFCFGMICRYAPDIWIRTIDENVIAAELIDSILRIVYRKFPNLILDQMTQSKHYIPL
ncbi:YaaC family protein [Floridanema aerugineum]|uniref:YaaC family protein n=1 Tax=Floridaenema aerugineum BLCC-F46 TaxID=3153654 RepID=A0ABV4XE43_9CYAN